MILCSKPFVVDNWPLPDVPVLPSESVTRCPCGMWGSYPTTGVRAYKCLPYRHKVEYVRHPRAVAKEAAHTDLEHYGDHQHFVTESGGERERLVTFSAALAGDRTDVNKQISLWFPFTVWGGWTRGY